MVNLNGMRDRAVRKANAQTLLREMSHASEEVKAFRYFAGTREEFLAEIMKTKRISRVYYACLMTAFGF